MALRDYWSGDGKADLEMLIPKKSLKPFPKGLLEPVAEVESVSAARRLTESGSKDRGRGKDREDRTFDYRIWHRRLSNSLYQQDIDSIEFTFRRGEFVPLAVVELTRSDHPTVGSGYLDNIVERFEEKDAQAKVVRGVAEFLGVGAWIVLFQQTHPESRCKGCEQALCRSCGRDVSKEEEELCMGCKRVLCRGCGQKVFGDEVPIPTHFWAYDLFRGGEWVEYTQATYGSWLLSMRRAK